MYTGFNVITTRDFERYYEIGKKKYDRTKRKVKEDINLYIDTDGSINGSELQGNWFPTVNADVFISHSHKDEKQAIGLAGWLFHEFRLESFIDSCVWGYSNDLLKQIDDKYCKSTTNTNTYCYESRNFSTSHVYMMLSAALNQMIDSTECIFFLNTKNSLSAKETIDKKTNSPWIYSELVTTQLIRKKNLREYRETLRHGSINNLSEKGGRLDILYDVYLDHLETLNDIQLDEWEKTHRVLVHELDNLYLVANSTFKSKYKALLEGKR